MPAVVITSFSPNPVSCRGGTTLTVLGTFPLNRAIAVTIGGTSVGPVTSDDEVSLAVRTPELPPGLYSMVLTFGGDNFEAPTAVQVIEHNWQQKTFSTRVGYPPWYGIGPRRLEIATLDVATAAQQEEDMLPRLTWVSVTAIKADVLAGLFANPTIRFSDGVLRTVTGFPFTFDPAAAVGLGGLDAGSEAADTWYYLYLAIVGGVTGIIGSTVTPVGAGPAGASSYRYIGAVRNNASSALTKFVQSSTDTFKYEDEVEVTNKEPASITALSKTALHDPAAAYDVGDVVPPKVASEAILHLGLQKDGGGGGTLGMDLFVDGHIDTVTTGGFGSAKRHSRIRHTGTTTFDIQDNFVPIPLPIAGASHPQIGLRLYRNAGAILPNDFFARMMGWKDAYLG